MDYFCGQYSISRFSHFVTFSLNLQYISVQYGLGSYIASIKVVVVHQVALSGIRIMLWSGQEHPINLIIYILIMTITILLLL